MADSIKFDRTPYTVSYQDLEGNMQSYRRVPPPKLHDILPTDVVELTQQKNDDFKVGDEVEVLGINPRHPNTLQLKNSHGDTTFVEYFDTNLLDEVAPRPDDEMHQGGKLKSSNRYLLWP